MASSQLQGAKLCPYLLNTCKQLLAERGKKSCPRLVAEKRSERVLRAHLVRCARSSSPRYCNAGRVQCISNLQSSGAINNSQILKVLSRLFHLPSFFEMIGVMSNFSLQAEPLPSRQD